MYCPQCGNEQANNNVRFCSRCGFQLGAVTELLANQGAPPNQLPSVAMPPKISQRKKGMKNGAKLMFLSAVLMPIFIGFCIIADHPGPLVFPFTVFLAGLCWLLYSHIFGEETAFPPVQNYPQQFNANPPRTALPSAENYRVSGMAPPRINTSEIVNPSSVTDHTTQLFDKE